MNVGVAFQGTGRDTLAAAKRACVLNIEPVQILEFTCIHLQMFEVLEQRLLYKPDRVCKRFAPVRQFLVDSVLSSAWTDGSILRKTPTQ